MSVSSAQIRKSTKHGNMNAEMRDDACDLYAHEPMFHEKEPMKL